MEHFLSVAVSPLSITLYNYLCKNIPNYKLKKLRGAILIFSAFLVCSAFPVVFILEHFMTNYVDAIHVLILLFASQIFFTVVKCIYVNLYKANKMQTKYFQRWISVIAVAFISNIDGSKLKKLGWNARYDIKQGLVRTLKMLMEMD